MEEIAVIAAIARHRRHRANLTRKMERIEDEEGVWESTEHP